ncbi:hypothetical protein Tco_0546411 [Tanacetum coccineum]
MAALKYKDDHNKIAYLGRERGCEDFTDILSYLDQSLLRYALTHAPPVVFDSLVKKFWATAVVRPNAAGSHDLVATIDGREVVMTESLIRTQLQFDDANGIFGMPNNDILEEGMIGNLKATKHKFLMYPRFLQMIVALETADRTPRPTFDFTRKMFANMKFKWEGQPIPLTTPMLAIAAAGNDAAGGDDAANEDNAAANEAAGSAAEAHLVPHSPPVSPVREPTPERQPHGLFVPVPFAIRDPILSLSLTSPPAQTFIFEEPLVFGPEPRPAGYVDPDVIEPIIFGPQPRPHGYVDPDFVEPIIFGPQPRPDNYLELRLDNIISMEDDTTHGGFHVESPVRPDDVPTPTADAAGRAEDPALLTGLSAKLDRCMGRIDSLESELGKSKKIMGGAILTLVSRVKKLEKTVKQLRETRLVVDASAAEGDVDIQDDIGLDGLAEREEEEVPLRRKRSAYRRARTEFSTPAFEQFQANLSAGVLPHTAVIGTCWSSVDLIGKVTMPDLDIPAEFLAEDAQARQQRWLNLMRQVVLSCIGKRSCLGADVNERTLSKRMTDVKEKKKRSAWQISLSSTQGCHYELLIRRQGFERVTSQPASVPAATTLPADDPDSAGGGSSNPVGSATPMAGSAASNTVGGAFGATVTDSTVNTPAAMDSAGSRRGPSPSNVSTDQIPIAVLFESTSGDLNEFFLESDEEEQIGMSRVVADPDSDDEVIAEIIFRGEPFLRCLLFFSYFLSPLISSLHLGVRSDDSYRITCLRTFLVLRGELLMTWRIIFPPSSILVHLKIGRCELSAGKQLYSVYYQENRRAKVTYYLKSRDHVYREDLLLLRRRMNRYFRLNPEVDVGLELWRDVNMLCQSLHSDDVEDFWRTQDEWIVRSWKLYPKSSVHVLDLTNGKTVLTVPPSYCRAVVVAGNIIQTVQAGFRQAYECLASAPIACTARQMVFSSPWLTAKKESGSPLQTALVCFSNPLMVARLPKIGWLPKLDGIHFPCSCWDEKWLVQEGTALELASPEQNGYRLRMLNPWYGCDSLPKTVKGIPIHPVPVTEKLDWFFVTQGYWKLLFFDVATSSDSAVHRVHAVSFDAAVLDVASTVSAACIVAAGYIVSAGICDAAGSFRCSFLLMALSVSADYVPAGHVLIFADRYRIC